ncbi:hypothetical protein GCM10023083_82500 [Streptomyces phyllanthi]
MISPGGRRLLRSRNLRRRLAVAAAALVMALPLLIQPELWQYLTAALLVHELMLRLAGGESRTTESPNPAQLPHPQRGEHSDATSHPSESDSVRASGYRM